MADLKNPLDAATLPEAIERSARLGRPGLVFHSSGKTDVLTPTDAVGAAERGARWLASLGVTPGDRVGVLGPNALPWAASAASIWRLGATLVPIPYTLIGERQHQSEQIAAIVERLQCRLVLAAPQMLDLVPCGARASWSDVADCGLALPPPPDAEDVAVLLLSSGSTAAPKGILLPHRSVMASIRSAAQAMRSPEGGHRAVGWLPYFHDFGLFAFLARPLVAGIETHMMSLEQFVMDPLDWWRLVGKVRATYTGAPPSAWVLAAREAQSTSDSLDLSSLDSCSMGAETTSAETLALVRAETGRFGMSREALFVTYGLAEATLGVTGWPGEPARIDEISKTSTADAGEARPARAGEARKLVVSCGRPLPSAEIRIVGDLGALPERMIGEIHVRMPSLMRGYVGTETPHPISDGWLRTGDLGYTADGHLYVTGRLKDIVIVMGCNYAAEDLEWTASGVSGVRRGRSVAFSKPDSDDTEAVVLVEMSDGADARAVAQKVKREILTEVGSMPLEVVVVARGSIAKTTSGKLRRSAMKSAYAAGSLAVLYSTAAN